jgi:hypothetical protein
MNKYFICLRGRAAPASHQFVASWRAVFPADRLEDVSWQSDSECTADVRVILEHGGNHDDAFNKLRRVLGPTESSDDHFEKKVSREGNPEPIWTSPPLFSLPRSVFGPIAR